VKIDLDLVRALRAREHRERTGCHAVEGVRFLVSASDAGAIFEGLVVCDELLVSVVGRMIVRRSKQRGVPVTRVSPTDFASVSRLEDGSGRGVIAIVRQRVLRVDRVSDLWLAIETVRSPGNLGTLLRTCLAVGARGVLVVGDADLYDPACVRATMGALSSLDVVRVADVAELRALARRSGARLVGTSPDARIDFRKTDYRGTTIIAVGCERRGITRAMRDACDVLVRIPMRNVIDSLNLAVAGSLVLYEAYAQRAT
jgi:TrmH family RNA methyltransferase